MSIINHFANVFDMEDFDPKHFVSKYEWNDEAKAVHMNLTATKEQNFVFDGTDIHIPKGKKYYVIDLRKFSEDYH